MKKLKKYWKNSNIHDKLLIYISGLSVFMFSVADFLMNNVHWVWHIMGW